jgi:hypothetical protein
MSANDLTTLDTLKQWLPVKSDIVTDDATLGRLITAVSQDFMRATKRPDLLQADYTEVRQGDGAQRLAVYHWPIVAVDLLKVATVAIPASADKIAVGYFFDQDIDPERIFNLYLIGSAFTDAAAVQIDYTAGYVQPGATPTGDEIALPNDIEQAVLDWCGYRYKQRPNVGVTQRRSTEGEQTGLEIVDAPPNVLQVIERYARCIPSVNRRLDEREYKMAIARPDKSRSRR